MILLELGWQAHDNPKSNNKYWATKENHYSLVLLTSTLYNWKNIQMKQIIFHNQDEMQFITKYSQTDAVVGYY